MVKFKHVPSVLSSSPPHAGEGRQASLRCGKNCLVIPRRVAGWINLLCIPPYIWASCSLKWYLWCSSCLFEAVLSKIHLQLLNLKVMDCCPCPDWASVDLFIVVRTRAEWSNQHLRCAQNGSRKLAGTDNTNNTKFSAALFMSTRKKNVNC